jgi:multidrug efflux system membrane fusion protein
MKQYKRKIAVIATIVVATTIGGAFAIHSLHGETEDHVPAHSPSNHPKLNPNGSELVVRTFRIGGDPNGQSSGTSHTFTGSLQPRYLASVGFRVAGKIAERKVELGQQIQKGQILYRLDPEDSELQLRVAESDYLSAQSLLSQATAEESRLATLRKSKSVSQSEYDLALSVRDVAAARVESSKQRLTLAQNQRAYFDLAADSDGLVTSILAEAGQVVNIGQPVLQVMQQNELEAIVSLPEGLIPDVKRFCATALFWSRPGLELRAELRELSPIADPVSRTYDARFRLLDSAPDLAIGMTASIRLTDESSSGIAVPITAIASRNSLPIVWRAVRDAKRSDSARVEAVSVEVIQYRSDGAIVRGHLEQGDEIISAGVQRIDEQVTVRIWEAN